jgi:2-polyprenyl-3-methyl-5-hydroxy-6-metoxy-1,4-benzoquinol methylase
MTPEALDKWHEDIPWSAGVQKFWDEAHRKGSPTRLGLTEAHQYGEYFSKAGPFGVDFNNALGFLDVGPGLGAYMRSIPEGKDRHAIDVSRVSRLRMEELGVKAYKPGEIGVGVADLATCLSVIQHCTKEASDLIFADVARALRPGGKFYLNGICGGHASSHPTRLVTSGRCSYTPAEACALAERHGFEVLEQHVYKGGSTTIWILYLTKP